MMQYDGDALIPSRYLVSPPGIDNTMGEYLAKAGVPQLAISETQKFGHVTYFFNGNRTGKFSEELEDYIEVPSDRVPFEERPWMKAAEITDKVVEAIGSGRYRFIRLNFANGDMVGHTGILPAVEIAVETVDLCLGRILHAIRETDGILIVPPITATRTTCSNATRKQVMSSSMTPAGSPKPKPPIRSTRCRSIFMTRPRAYPCGFRNRRPGHQQPGGHDPDPSGLRTAGRLYPEYCRHRMMAAAVYAKSVPTLTRKRFNPAV
jgi:hypothetical protein